MSLVDYASSSEDEEVDEAQRVECNKEEKDETEENIQMNESTATVASTAPPPVDPTRPSSFQSIKQIDGAMSSFVTPIRSLPNASVLLTSPSFSSEKFTDNYYSARLPTSLKSTFQKRASNGSTFTHTPSKHPRCNLPHSRSIPDTGGGALIPPQLRGRSNVVTEDINKLFVKRQQRESSR
ncbi:hypothetical protein HPP92_001654 [Vanilla planifolia]|uniref:Uncharacterized protein n=1 Tax=Vanilla planifolia TaxID=51239 RepID=A0A835RUD7_VANPL|nr:hypothetical protein HPP92_001654 [Vanilla planifolia]